MALIDETFSGSQSAYTFPGMGAYGSAAMGALPGSGGSTGGVPDNASVASGDPNSTTAVHKSQAQTGAAAANGPAWNQPIFWAVVSTFVGLFLLGHVASMHVKGT